jgi:predicted HTH transcriptional regulator
MSLANMDESDLDELHRAILDELHEGRVTPSYVAEQTGESRQLMNSRLRDLVMGSHVRKVHKGLYELVDDPRGTDDGC